MPSIYLSRLTLLISILLSLNSFGGAITGNMSDDDDDVETLATTSVHLLPFDYAKLKTQQLDSKQLGLCFAKSVIQVPNLQLFSQAATKTVPIRTTSSKPPLLSTTFFDYLAANSARTIDFTSGLESALESWIDQQPVNSIHPFSIFQESLKISHNDLWASLLTIHQLMRNHARFFQTSRYAFNSNPDIHHEFFSKFVDIRGDLTEFGRGNGDHAGTWYRIWGAMLFDVILLKEQRADSFSANSFLSACYQKTSVNCRILAAKTVSDSVFFADEIVQKQYGRRWKGLTPDPDSDRKLEYDKRAAYAISWMLYGLYHRDLIDKTKLSDCSGQKYLVSQ